MKRIDDRVRLFFELLRLGLWEKDSQVQLVSEKDFCYVFRLAEEQTVIGLVTAGIEHSKGINVPQSVLLQFVGQSLKLEQQNKELNEFIAGLVERMRKADIYTLLIKGQGIAQCYERPLWRVSGDVDLLLSNDNYEKAKAFMIPLATGVEQEGKYSMHLGLTIDSWVVELHGAMRCGLSKQIDKELDAVKNDLFYGGNIRSWMNGRTSVFLPSPNNDAVYLFTHILQHFYKGGIGLRQICDWCRLLWTYRADLNLQVLESRISKAGLISEWKAFVAFAVNWLGMPEDAMPLYSSETKWKRKADRICIFIIEVGNFGHNRDMSYYINKPYIVRKAVSLCRRCGDLYRHAKIFPLDSIRFFPRLIINGLISATNGE